MKKNTDIKLKVVEALQDDVYKGVARIDPNLMRALGLNRGDYISIVGGRETVAIVDRAYPADVGEKIIRIDGLIRKNARTSVGEQIAVKKANIVAAKKVSIAPAQKGLMIQADPEFFKNGLLGRAVVKGDVIALGSVQRRRDVMNDGFPDIFGDLQDFFGGSFGFTGFQQMRFLVISATPNQPCVINEYTEVILNPKAVEVTENILPGVTYEDIGGLSEEVRKIREMVELPLKHPEIFDKLGIEPPKGVILQGPPGTGKTLLAKAVANETDSNFVLLNGPECMCVGGETNILTNPKGYVKAQEIFEQKGNTEDIGNYILKKLDEPISTYSYKDGKIEKAHITHVTKLNAESYKVKLSDGNQVEVSENQPFLVYRNSELVWETAKNLKEGDFIARLNKLNLPEESYKIPLDELKFVSVERDTKYAIQSKNLSRSNFIKLAERTTPELMELLGLIVSDGNISGKGDSVGFYSDDKDLIERFKFLMRKVFGIDNFKERKQGNLFGAIVYSKLLVEYLKILGFFNRNKEVIPAYFFSLPKNEIQAFVKGYFDGDGTVSRLRIKNMIYPTQVLYSVKKEFLMQLQSLMLLKLGIQCKIQEHKTPKGLMHKLVVRGNEGRVKFLDIGATSKHKFERLKEIKKVVRIKEHENIPHPSLLIDSIRNNLPYKEYRNKDYYIYKNGKATKHSLKVLYDLAMKNNILNENIKKEFGLLTRNDIGWEKIESIESCGKKELFDFTVDKDSFVGAPYFFLHNSKFYGESEKKVRDIFEEAEKNAPSIIFIDEIDAIAPKREDVQGEVERRVVSQLLTMMDGLKSRGRVVVIGATNRINSIDPALRRPGRFDREISISVPDKAGRLNILKIHTRSMPLKGVNLDILASKTHGFVGADLSALTKEAAMNVLRKLLPELKLEDDVPIPSEILDKISVKIEDFEEALKVVRPSAMREVLVETPNISWNDIGGLDSTKQSLKEAVEWPLKNFDGFKNLGIRPPRGILLYGPPGTGKTLLAKAVAKESEANFINVKGPSLLCIAGNVPIISSLCGLQKIENFYNILEEDSIVENKDNIEYLVPKNDVFIQALKDKKINLSKVVRAYKLNVKDVYKVTFEDGNFIEVSANQPFFAFDNGLSWIKSRDLKEGVLIAYPNKLNIFNKQIEIKIPDNKDLRLIREDNNFNYVKIFSSKREARLPKFMNEQLAEFLGWFVSEGSISKEKISVKVYNISSENKKRIKELFELFVSKDRIKEFDKGVAVYSAPLIYYLEELFGQKLGGKKSYSIKVPKRIFFGDERIISAFLRGAWLGDGHVDELKAEYGSMSEELSQGISYLLTFLGIRHRFWNRKDNMFMITISGKEDLIKFNNSVFKRDYGIEVRRYYNAHLILPQIGYLLRKLKEKAGLKYSKTNSEGKYIPEGLFEAIISGRKEIGIHRLRRIISIFEDKLNDEDKNSEEFKILKFLVESDLLWMRVKKIENAKEQIMYDIETEDGNFVGGKRPLLLHNSMWVGESEKGVRKIFERARQVAPCIIFFDEIDSLAGRRGVDMGTRVTERVLNQLLAEMDGLEEIKGVTVIGATNRPDMLDPALLRPGRFDRIILVDVPDSISRRKILEVHIRNTPLGSDVNIGEIVKMTEGFVGADIEALVREAAMNALRRDMESKLVTKEDFDEAFNRVKSSVSAESAKRYKKIEEYYLRSAKAGMEIGPVYTG